MRANRPSCIRTLFQCAAVRGEMSRSIASSASLLSVPESWPNRSSTRCSARPAFSSATMVLSKVGAAVWLAILAISASCSAKARS